MSGRTKAAIGLASAVLCGVVIGGGLFLRAEDEPWPPDWYVDPGTDRTGYAALRRRAIVTPSTEFPPSEAALAYLRNVAVGAALDPGSRLDDARVYSGSGYVLQLRGKFSTVGISGPPGARRRALPPFAPCVTLFFDPSMLFTTAVQVGTTGKCEDLSFLGDGVELDLREERG